MIGGRKHWFVYLVREAGGSIYTGVTTDVDRRVGEHEAGRGAKYLRGRKPLVVLYRRRVGDRGLALRIERRIKRLTRIEKQALVREAPSRRALMRALEASARA
jgi:putative endonuclease